MRPIDADALKKHIDKLPALPDGNFAGNHSALKALVNMQPTIKPSTNSSESPNGWKPVSKETNPSTSGWYIVTCPQEMTAGDISDLIPYTEPDREAIENEVWEVAKEISLMQLLKYDEFMECFGEELHYMPYKDVKTKYDVWKKKKEQIHVGDEVETESGNKACVLYENPDGTQMFVFKADGTATWWSKCAIHKTGKNHPEVAELLKKMREE